MYTQLIEVAQLKELMNAKQRVMIFDCSFDLMAPESGHQAYLKEHVPHAIYANLDTDLSAKHGVAVNGVVLTTTGADEPVSGGRHPLPSREKFAYWLSEVGFHNDMQAVVYDRNGVNYCGRLWWMLKWAGHDAVAVLNGGFQAWQAAGEAVSSGKEPAHFQSNFVLGEPLRKLVTAKEVESNLGKGTQTLIDARAPARYRGEVEPLDPVAGHIPGAVNRPFGMNFDANGKFKSQEVLRKEFDELLQGRDPSTIVNSCGSGVSATPNVLALELAGLGQPALFAGSWSEWCSVPSRPVEKG